MVKFDPETAENNPDIEKQWAVVSLDYALTYLDLLIKFGPERMKFSKFDDEIYADFRESFPDYNVRVIDPETLKSPEAKELWRPWINKYEKRMDMFNFGTLLRIDESKGYTEQNTLMAVRIQFYAIELARCREGMNREIDLE
ncbi:hypothetical protein MP638_002988 [Amoeboaphelidium occidentale]|nr:hypothetical protein MP638_002988 [Amoeboaphelidium occidentale]